MHGATAAGPGCSGSIPCGGSRSCRFNLAIAGAFWDRVAECECWPSVSVSRPSFSVSRPSVSVSRPVLIPPRAAGADARGTARSDPRCRRRALCAGGRTLDPYQPHPSSCLGSFHPLPPSPTHTIARSHRGRRRLRCRHTAGPGAGAGGWGAGVPAHKLVSAAHPCV